MRAVNIAARILVSPMPDFTITDHKGPLLKSLSKYYGGNTYREQAEKLEAALRRYQLGRWRFDKDKQSMPEEYKGGKSELLYKLLLIGNGKINKASRISEILSGRRCKKGSFFRNIPPDQGYSERREGDEYILETPVLIESKTLDGLMRKGFMSPSSLNDPKEAASEIREILKKVAGVN